MKSLKTILIASSLLASFAASASAPPVIEKVRALLPAGRDIAQLQYLLMDGSTSEAESYKLATQNFVIRDINGDGINDVLVISEEKPKLQELGGDQPCKSTKVEDCQVIYGARTLHLFYGQADGSMKLAFSNDQIVLTGDSGGTFGDPLDGMNVRPNGSITLLEYGGSSWRWSYTDTFQFRGHDFYLIGNDSYEGWTGDGRSDTKSMDLITGQVVESHAKTGNSPVQYKKYRIPVKPLERVANVGSPQN